MDTKLIEAISEFRDATQVRQRLDQELLDCQERLQMLEHEVSAAYERFREARLQLLNAVVVGGGAPAGR